MNWLLTSYCVLNKLFYIISYKGIIYKIMWQCDAAHFLCDLNISQLSTRFKKKGYHEKRFSSTSAIQQFNFWFSWLQYTGLNPTTSKKYHEFIFMSAGFFLFGLTIADVIINPNKTYAMESIVMIGQVFYLKLTYFCFNIKYFRCCRKL